MKKILKVIFAVILTGCCLLIYSAVFARESSRGAIGMFSWKSDVFQDDGAQLFAFMRQNGFTELYQAFSSSLDSWRVSAFLSNAKKERIAVYALAGSPEWALDPEGKAMCEAVDKAVKMHIAAGGGIQGIVLDVEPYTLPAWEDDAENMMETFVSGMKQAYSLAALSDFEVVVCIPYYLDDLGVDSGLKSLIRTGCDRIAIMNYYKSLEITHIQNELRYAQRYGKGVINIFEFKPPGEHGLVEMNTYYSDGFGPALLSYDEMKSFFYNADLMLAAHDYEALKEVLK